MWMPRLSIAETRPRLVVIASASAVLIAALAACEPITVDLRSRVISGDDGGEPKPEEPISLCTAAGFGCASRQALRETFFIEGCPPGLEEKFFLPCEVNPTPESDLICCGRPEEPPPPPPNECESLGNFCWRDPAFICPVGRPDFSFNCDPTGENPELYCCTETPSDCERSGFRCTAPDPNTQKCPEGVGIQTPECPRDQVTGDPMLCCG